MMRYTITFLMHTKDKALGAYKSYEAWATTHQHCRAIKVLCSDRGGEYLSKDFNQHLAKSGMARKLTAHDTPQLNGIAECLNHTLLEQIRAFTHTSGLPKSLWGEALRHATWLKNQMATCSLDGKMPFEALYSRLPDLSAICTWGSPVLVHNANGSKLDVRACEACWLGFDVDTRAHQVFWPGLGNVTVEQNVYFGTPAPLEGEGRTMQVAGSKQADAPPSPSTSPAPKESDMFSHAETLIPTHTNESELQAEPPAQPHCSTCLQKPSHIMCNIQSGEGIPAQHVPGLQILGLLVEEAEEAGGVWTITDGSPALLEDFDGLEHVFMAETANAEALEPHSLTEAK